MTTTAARTLFVFLTFVSALIASPGPATSDDVRSTPPAAGYSMEILVDGVPLERHVSRGRTYVEALPGREYSIRLRNHTDLRTAFALSVDGLNTIDAKTTSARTASKWILDPWQEITIDGWQTSASKARRFFFTTEESSYGAWLGKTTNLGVIAVAVFREKRMKAQAPSRGAMEAEPRSMDLSDDSAATGIGEEVGHDVVRVPFDAESAPAAMLEVRYEYRDALVRLGVLRQEPCDPLCRRERARGFEGMEFAPDPYR
jgi:hypothetical protein